MKKYDPKTYQKNKKRYQETARRHLYGLSPGEHADMLQEQDGACGICGEKPACLCVDHNHRTGKVRGLLCVACNTAVGMVKDSEELAQKLTDYLTYHNAVDYTRP